MKIFGKTNGSKLHGMKIAVLAADGFEKMEAQVPMTALRAAGASLEVVSIHGGKIRGVNLTEPSGTMRVDRTLREARPEDYEGLFVPGGFVGPDLLRQTREAREFVRAFVEADKPVATLCHGPWVLASADCVRGRVLSGWPGLRDDLVNAGAVWRNEEIVRDGNLVSSRGPQDMAAFVPAMLDLFADHVSGAPKRPRLDSNMQSSPRVDAPPSWAVAGARVLPRPLGIGALLGAVATIAVAGVGARFLKQLSA